MQIGVAYCDQHKKFWLKLDVPEGTTVERAIELSGLLQKMPDIDLEQQRVGIFGKLTKLDALVSEGERIEIYRPITADPEMVERRS